MNLANKITIGRILIIPFLILSFVYYRQDDPLLRSLPLIIFLLAMLSDGIDGLIARSLKQKTRLGTVLDPIADKLILVSTFLCLSIQEMPGGIKPPMWVLVIVISRDAMIIFGSVIIYFIKGDINIRPTPIGKITTFLQMVAILSLFFQFPKSYIILNIMVLFTVLSGIDYIRKGSFLLNENP